MANNDLSLDFLVHTLPSILFKWSSCIVIIGKNFDLTDLSHLESFSTECSLVSIKNLKEINLQKENRFILLGEIDEFVLLISNKISDGFKSNSLSSLFFIENFGNISSDFPKREQFETWDFTARHFIHFGNFGIDSQIYFGSFINSSFNIYEFYKVCSSCPIRKQKLCSLVKSNDVYKTKCQADFYARRNNLEMLNLKAVSVNVLPFFAQIDHRQIITGGLFGTVFLSILQQLNATYDLTVLRGYQYGAFINGSWDGVMGYLSRSEVDLTVSELSLASDRLDFIDYTASFDSVGRKIYVKKVVQQKIINWEFYTAPFSPFLHLSIVFWITLMMFLLWFSERFRRVHNNFSLKETFWIAFSFLCQKGAHIVPTNRTSKIIFIVFGFTFLIIYSAYSATLISQLSISPPISVPFKDLQDFVTKADNWKGGPISGDLTQVYMEKTCPELLKHGENSQCELLVNLWNKIVKPDKETLPKSFQEGLERVLNGKFAFIATSHGARSQISSNFSEEDACHILEMSGDYISSNLAFGIRRNFPYKRLINYNLLQLQKSGVIKRLQKFWLPQKKLCSTPSNFQDATINDVGIAPCIYSFGFIFSLIFCLFELLYFRQLNDIR